MSFLCALVDLGVFREVVVYFLLVGHTGNIVDQKFSILTQELKKSEIKTLEDLVDLIENSPINPKPDVESLRWTWDWKQFITGHLSEKKLENHSFFNAFRIVQEDGTTRLRVKRLPQETLWGPPTGVNLLKKNITYDPVQASEFRVASLNLDKVVHDLQRYFQKMPTHVRVTVSNSWNKLKETLEALPRMRNNLPPMKLLDLPKLPGHVTPVLPDHYEFVAEKPYDLPELVGQVCEVDLFDEHIQEGVDVVVYTKSKVGRPWVGRVQEILPGQKFVIHWYDRQGKSLKFHQMMKSKKEPYLSKLPNSSVMFWSVFVNRTETSFQLTPYWLTKIAKEYEKYDLKLG